MLTGEKELGEKPVRVPSILIRCAVVRRCRWKPRGGAEDREETW